MKKWMLAASLMALAGCAGHGTHAGMSWQDGSWYSPAAKGHGDYYTGNTRRPPYAYDAPWDWSVGFVPFGGFCPVAYRYCTSFWADPWYSAAPYAWYYPLAYVPRHRPHPRPALSMTERSMIDPDSFGEPPRGTQAPEPGARHEPADWGGGRSGGDEARRERRRGGRD